MRMGGVAQVVERLHSKLKALNSNPSTAKKKKKKKSKARQGRNDVMVLLHEVGLLGLPCLLRSLHGPR
jgi:hypothetical protein